MTVGRANTPAQISVLRAVGDEDGRRTLARQKPPVGQAGSPPPRAVIVYSRVHTRQQRTPT